MLCIVLTNRRDLYFSAALASLDNVTGITKTVIVDDSGDLAWRNELTQQCNEVWAPAIEPAGYTKAMQLVWHLARSHGGPVFFLEEDFTVDVPVNLDELAAILTADPELAQIALVRQAWYPIERRHGGVIGALAHKGHTFTIWPNRVQHTACFTGNPSLIAPIALNEDWPGGEWTEDAMTQKLVRAGYHFAYLGDGRTEHVTHHGHQRAETSHGY